MKNFLRKIFLVTCLFSFYQADAAHQVGGYIEYRCLPSPNLTENTFEVTFRFYVDSVRLGTGNTPGDSIPITVFNNNVLVDYFYLSNLIGITSISDDLNNPCIVFSPTRSVAEYLYRDTISLLKGRDYKLVYQRCCKNNILTNLVGNSNFYGNTFSADIPSLPACNSTPIFNSQPPTVVCSGFDINLDMSAIDPDGDSLVYSLCAPLDFNQSQLPLNSAGQTIPNPDTANAPPYLEILFQSPQSGTNPIPSNPQIVIDSSTGLLTGTPTTIGAYLLGFCVKEYRNNVLINTFRRDIQISTADCSAAVVSAVQNQTRFCTGDSVKFSNLSTSTGINPPTYFWDFGVPNETKDTSRERSPWFVFPDTGLYFITLIVNKGYPQCDSTSVEPFQVNRLLDPSLNVSGGGCFNNNKFDFNAGGVFESYATFKWDFGSQAVPQTSTTAAAIDVSFNNSGSFPVQLIVSQDKCSDTTNRTIELFDNPSADFSTADSAGCSPHSVQFTSNINDPGAGVIPGIYKWNFGDGSPISNLPNPTHQYTQDGSYVVTLTYESNGSCVDTVVVEKQNFIRVGQQFSNNKTDFSASPLAGCYPLEVQFSNLSSFDGDCDIRLGFWRWNSRFDRNKP